MDATNTTRVQATAKAPFALSLRQDYNDQTVQINIPSGITLKTINNGPTDYTHNSTSNVTLTQTLTAQDGTKYPLTRTATETTIILTCYATSVGKKTFTISDTTPSNDRPTGDRAAESVSSTVYITQHPHLVPDRASIRFAGINNGYDDGHYFRAPLLIYGGDSGNYEVTYTATPVDTNATVELYVQETQGRTLRESPATSLTTSSAADVYLTSTAATTVRVTAEITGGPPTFVGVYIYGRPTLQDITLSSDPLSGNVGQDVPGAFTAAVQDEGNDAVAGVPIKFEVKDKTRAGGYLTFNTGASPPSVGTIVDANNNEILNRDGSAITEVTDKILYIRTGTSNVVVGFQIGTARKQEVTVSAVGMTKVVR